jgi:polysaccharide pyruvyl transferase WcaK-like protein
MCNVDPEKWWRTDEKNFIASIILRVVCGIRAIPNPILRKIGGLVRVPLELLLEPIALLRAYKCLKGMDLFIVSGGGQLDDYWGGVGKNPYALLLWGTLARLRKIKFLMVSLGAGPINSPLSKLFIRMALMLASYRSYRDEDSRNYIEKVVGFKKNDPIYPDLAHSLDLAQYQTFSSQQKHRPVVGIGPMTYFDPRVWPEKDSSVYLGYLNKLASFVSWLIQKQYVILFFTGEAVTDRPVIKDLRDILDSNRVVYSEGQIIEDPIETLDDLMSQLAKTDLVISARFHGTLLPQMLNKPVLALSHHRKVEMLMADLGLSDYCLSIDTFDVDTLKERFMALETNQETIKQQLAKRTQEYRSALEEQYERLFKNL